MICLIKIFTVVYSVKPLILRRFFWNLRVLRSEQYVYYNHKPLSTFLFLFFLCWSQNPVSALIYPEDLAQTSSPQVQHCHSSLIFSNFQHCHPQPLFRATANPLINVANEPAQEGRLPQGFVITMVCTDSCLHATPIHFAATVQDFFYYGDVFFFLCKQVLVWRKALDAYALR